MVWVTWADLDHFDLDSVHIPRYSDYPDSAIAMCSNMCLCSSSITSTYAHSQSRPPCTDGAHHARFANHDLHDLAQHRNGDPGGGAAVLGWNANHGLRGVDDSGCLRIYATRRYRRNLQRNGFDFADHATP